MSFAAMAWAAKVRLPTVPKVVLMILAARGDKKEQCWPSLAMLADDTGLSERAVRNGIAKLLEAGLIAKRARGCAGMIYTVLPVLDAKLKEEPNGAKPAPRAGFKPERTRSNAAPGAGLTPAPNAALDAKTESKPAPGAANVAPGARNPVQEPIKEESSLRDAPSAQPPGTALQTEVVGPSARQVLFGHTLWLLQHMTGRREDGCRSLLGRWLRDTDDDAELVNRIVQEAANRRVISPVDAITKAVQVLGVKRGTRTQAELDRAIAGEIRRPRDNGPRTARDINAGILAVRV